ncbi:hypothetical protein [Alteribacillus bidgolensis]|uniref:hypothetical protein n=1 Tax=Alteribacillus bidgolensis TaxID=930129 RepID=UPI00111396D2|nr:hypothetical protein [Alteribacillus bidgolensis]
MVLVRRGNPETLEERGNMGKNQKRKDGDLGSRFNMDEKTFKKLAEKAKENEKKDKDNKKKK